MRSQARQITVTNRSTGTKWCSVGTIGFGRHSMSGQGSEVPLPFQHLCMVEILHPTEYR